jgi:hypothetical protein
MESDPAMFYGAVRNVIDVLRKINRILDLRMEIRKPFRHMDVAAIQLHRNYISNKGL